MDEDEYFAREDIEKLRRLHKDQVKALSQAQKEQLKAAHANRCPNCGMEMQRLPAMSGITLMRCFECGGTFIEPAEAQKLARAQKQDHAIVEAVISWFKHEDHR